MSQHTIDQFPVDTSKSAAIQRTKNLARASREGFKYNCPHAYNKHTKYTVAVDWLQLGVLLDEKLQPDLGGDFQKGVYRWLVRPAGSKHYRYIYDVYIGAKQFYVVEVSPRKGKDDTNAIVKLENWLLYDDWHTELQRFLQHNTRELLRISRLDIAFDGLNNIYNMMCDFAADKNDAYGVKLIGKSKISAHELSRITKRPKGFTVGTSKGLKQIAIYNKSKDILRNQKNYIKEYWHANGLDVQTDVYRFEVRLKNKYLETLTGDKLREYTPAQFLANIQDLHFLTSVVNTALVGFFEWVYMDDTNTTRCTRVLIIPPPHYALKRNRTDYNGTAYKAKMQIHNTFFQTCAEIIGKEEGIAIIRQQLAIYDLHDWYATRFHDFAKRYRPEQVETLLELSELAMVKDFNKEKKIRSRMLEIYFSKNSHQLTLKKVNKI